MPPRRSGRLKPPIGLCNIGTPESHDANKKRVSIDCLPDALLLHVLARVEQSSGYQCREVLPLVCKKWSLLTKAPSPLWEDVLLDFCCKKAPHERLLRSAFQHWLKPRAASVQKLTLRNSSADSTHSFPRDGKSLTNIFDMLAGGLQCLEVFNCNDIFTHTTFQDLHILQHMRTLHLTSCRQRFGQDHLSCLSSLTNLKDIKLASDTDYENVLSLSCISTFPSVLLKLTQLTSLSLSSSGLEEVPDQITKLSNLRCLSLDSCNKLTFLTDKLSGIKSLQELSLDDTCACILLADSLVNLVLEKLSLRRSKIYHNSGKLNTCRIVHLDVSQNSFALPLPGRREALMQTFQCMPLKVLNLNSCEMDTFPTYMWGFAILKVLDLGNNGLVELPDSFSRMASLECLNLQGNSFPKLPQALQKLKSLCCLSLVACNYLEIPTYDDIAFFAKWHQLRSIWMWKTEDVDYQDYSKAALQQLDAKLKRKRKQEVHLCYIKEEAPDVRKMQGWHYSVTLTPC